MLGLRFRARAPSSCGKRGPLFIAVHGPLTVAASLVVEHRLQTCRLSSCGSQAQLLRGMWDPPRPGLEPTSPALAGRPPTTAPPGKPLTKCFNYLRKHCLIKEKSRGIKASQRNESLMIGSRALWPLGGGHILGASQMPPRKQLSTAPQALDCRRNHCFYW